MKRNTKGYASHLNIFIRTVLLLILITVPYASNRQIPNIVKNSFTQKQKTPKQKEQPINNEEKKPAWQIYTEEQILKKDTQTEVELIFGKPFSEFSQQDYTIFLSGLNLDRDEDIFLWSHVTEIPIIALRKTNYFFRMNLHLLEDIAFAEQLDMQTAYQFKTLYDENTHKITILDQFNYSHPLRQLPNNLLMPIDRYKSYWYNQNFTNNNINYNTIGPYLIHFSDLPYRGRLKKWIQMLPLNIVKTYRGKAIYMTNINGRSFATTMPVSNMVYKLHIGLITGVWIEIRSDGDDGTEKNFIHEFGHVFDYAVLQGGYGEYRDNYQFPGFRELFTEKEAIFGIQDQSVPNTPFGYISNYAKSNAQESFAEHFRAYIAEKENFYQQAQQQAKEGHPELMQKYLFMEKMIDHTDTKMVPLSLELLEKESSSQLHPK